MSQQQMMAGMGGPVGGQQMNVGTPSGSGIDASPQTIRRKLNTAIYDYLLRNSLYDVARSFLGSMEIDKKQDSKESPKQANGVDDSMEDSSDLAIQNRPDGLPLPHNMSEGPFLQDWWYQFWEIHHGYRAKGNPKPNTLTYIGQQRLAQKSRMAMMGGNMDANTMQNMRYNNMVQMNNGMAMNPQDLKRTAMQQNQQRNLTPQQMQHMKNMQAQQNQQMMQANQMERQGSQMDMSGPRSGSPASGDGPSSPKRQRTDGNMPQLNQGRPGQPGQMQGNQSVETYSQSVHASMQAAMDAANGTKSNSVNKGMNPNMGPGGAQGSPMSQPGMDVATGEFYAATNGRMPMPQNAGQAAAAGQPGNTNGNHALQDYQMQLMLLEQQNKKRLLMARQEQDSMAHPAGVGPAGQFVPGSPGAGMVDPNIPPNVRAQMMLNQQNGGQPMQRPPSSHPMGNLTPQQVEMMRQQAAQQQGQMPNGAFQPPQGQMMQAQQGGQPGQPGQGQPMGTPRQQNNNMPPPPAPQTNAGGTQPSSPSAQAPAPPTPSQTKAAKPGTKKEAAAKKGAANKKGGNANATPATESEAPPTPTPATPATPMNKNSFAHQQNQQLSNGQPAAPAQANAQANNVTPQQNQTPQQQQNAVQQPAPPSAPDMNGPFGSLPLDDTFGDIGLGFGESDLDGFDFDSFLNTGDGVGTFEFDANLAFDGMDSSGGIEG